MRARACARVRLAVAALTSFAVSCYAYSCCVRARACACVRACGWQLQLSPLWLSHVMLSHALLPPSVSPVGEARGSLASPSSYSLKGRAMRQHFVCLCMHGFTRMFSPSSLLPWGEGMDNDKAFCIVWCNTMECVYLACQIR